MSTKTIILKILIPVILSGFLSYLPFSLAGEYKWSNYGGQDWRDQWHPRFMFEHYRIPQIIGRPYSRITIVGAMYWPCICIDRLIWHKTEFMEMI